MVAAALDRAVAELGGTRDAHATRIVERYAHQLCRAGAPAALAGAPGPELHPRSCRLRVDALGLVRDIGLEASAPSGGDAVEALRGALHAHLGPVVAALGRARDRGALWRAVGDEVAGTLLGIGVRAGRYDGAILVAERVLARPAAYRVPLRARPMRDGPGRRRHGCCLTYRIPGLERCADCPGRRSLRRFL